MTWPPAGHDRQRELFDADPEPCEPAKSDAVYFETFIGRCPACGETNPGHVTGLPEAGVYGWTCPIPECDHTAEPDEVERVRS